MVSRTAPNATRDRRSPKQVVAQEDTQGQHAFSTLAKRPARSPARRQDSRVVAGVYDALGNVGEFYLAFLGYGPQHIEGANIIDPVALHDDAFGLTNTVSRR
jgi:hypothetical protein